MKPVYDFPHGCVHQEDYQYLCAVKSVWFTSVLPELHSQVGTSFLLLTRESHHQFKNWPIACVLRIRARRLFYLCMNLFNIVIGAFLEVGIWNASWGCSFDGDNQRVRSRICCCKISEGLKVLLLKEVIQIQFEIHLFIFTQLFSISLAKHLNFM